MRVLNVMMGKNLGGLEQACIDYTEALIYQGHSVTTLVYRNAAILPQLKKLNTEIVEIANRSPWNFLERWRMRKFFHDHDVAILHGNRAGKLSKWAKLKWAKNSRAKILAVAHSRFFRFFPHFDGLIVLSEQGRRLHGEKANRPVFVMPNLVRAPKEIQKPLWRDVPVIGAMGRLSYEKGMDLFVDALSILKKENVRFAARIGGRGDELENLKKKIQDLNLNNEISFLGWVTDKSEFFKSVDVFCVPSRTESFGLTVIEAMSYGVPTLATKCDGPLFVIEDGMNGALVDIDATAIANKLKSILENMPSSIEMGYRGRLDVLKRYDLPIIARRLDGIMKEIIETKFM